jgi:alkyldihydroxyacetonephosphate synthase
MRRWNGWGESSVNTEVNAPALAWLAQSVGKGQAPKDALMQDMLALVKPSRLPIHALITTDSAERLRVGMGESYRDWICRRTGALPPLPDGVAFVETSEQVRELLDLAHSGDWIVIPYAGGTSVAGHLDCPMSERPVLSLNLSRMNRLLYLDPKSQLARFGAGASGPQVEAQLRAHGYTLGHFPQSFEYSTVGGWVVTRSSGQQSLRYGRIEQIFAGGRFEAPVGTLHIPTLHQAPDPTSAKSCSARKVASAYSPKSRCVSRDCRNTKAFMPCSCPIGTAPKPPCAHWHNAGCRFPCCV